MRNFITKSQPSHHEQRPTLEETPHTRPEQSLDNLLTWLDAGVSTDLADDDLFSFNRENADYMIWAVSAEIKAT